MAKTQANGSKGSAKKTAPARTRSAKPARSAAGRAEAPKKAPARPTLGQGRSAAATQSKRPAATPAQGPASGRKSSAPPAARAGSAREPAATNTRPQPAKTPAMPAAAAQGEGAAKKPAPKGITIVSQKPSRPAKTKSKFQMPVSEPLIKPGAKWKPLIPSGPSAPVQSRLGRGPIDGKKNRLPKKDLDRYRSILIRKRSELIGDISTIEDEALRQSGSGSLSHLPQHMAEQGTDVFDQALSLDLAQVDRNLIREIDAALGRIDDGSYGFCELTGKPIKPERLEELPWARYSIEAARERERRPYQV